MSITGPLERATSSGSVGIEVRGLSVAYGRFVAVADTSFRVEPGESFGIVGESGSGKTTVLRAMRAPARSPRSLRCASTIPSA